MQPGERAQKPLSLALYQAGWLAGRACSGGVIRRSGSCGRERRRLARNASAGRGEPANLHFMPAKHNWLTSRPCRYLGLAGWLGKLINLLHLRSLLAACRRHRRNPSPSTSMLYIICAGCIEQASQPGDTRSAGKRLAIDADKLEFRHFAIEICSSRRQIVAPAASETQFRSHTVCALPR